MKKVMRQFIKARLEEIQKTHKISTPATEEKKMILLCGQIREFWREHCDEIPKRLEILLRLVCSLLSSNQSKRKAATRACVRQGLLPLSKMPGGVMVDPCPNNYGVFYLVNLVMDMFRSDLSVAVEALKKGMDKVLEDIWPKYKERWED